MPACVCVCACLDVNTLIYNPSPSDKIIHIHIYREREHMLYSCHDYIGNLSCNAVRMAAAGDALHGSQRW